MLRFPRSHPRDRPRRRGNLLLFSSCLMEVVEEEGAWWVLLFLSRPRRRGFLSLWFSRWFYPKQAVLLLEVWKFLRLARCLQLRLLFFSCLMEGQEEEVSVP